MLHRGGGEGDKAVRMLGAQLRKLLVLRPDYLLGSVTVELVPDRIDAERLDVDALGIHLLDAQLGLVERRRRNFQARHGVGFRERAMRVDVDGLHALAADHDFAPRRGPFRVSVPRVQKIAADKGDRCSGGAGCAMDEFASGLHVVLPYGRCAFLIGRPRPA